MGFNERLKSFIYSKENTGLRRCSETYVNLLWTLKTCTFNKSRFLFALIFYSKGYSSSIYIIYFENNRRSAERNSRRVEFTDTALRLPGCSRKTQQSSFKQEIGKESPIKSPPRPYDSFPQIIFFPFFGTQLKFLLQQISEQTLQKLKNVTLLTNGRIAKESVNLVYMQSKQNSLFSKYEVQKINFAILDNRYV